MIKRFIAGAVCPRCGEMDRLVTYVKDGGTFRECVNCDFEEKQLAQVAMKELDTRVNHAEAPVEADAQPITFIPPKKK